MTAKIPNHHYENDACAPETFGEPKLSEEAKLAAKQSFERIKAEAEKIRQDKKNKDKG